MDLRALVALMIIKGANHTTVVNLLFNTNKYMSKSYIYNSSVITAIVTIITDNNGSHIIGR